MQDRTDDMKHYWARQLSHKICFQYAWMLSKVWCSGLMVVVIFNAFLTCGLIAFLCFNTPDFSQPIKGFEARGTDIKSRLASWNYYLEENEEGSLSWYPTLHNSEDYFEEIVSEVREVRDIKTMGFLEEPISSIDEESSSSSSFYSYDSVEEPQTFFCSIRYGDLDARIVFSAEAEYSLFSVEAIKSVCEFDNKRVRNHIDFQRHCLRQNSECCRSRSLGNYVALLHNKSSCSEIVKKDVVATLELLQFCSKYFHNRTLSQLCWDSRTDTKNMEYCHAVPTNCTRYNAVYMLFQFILSVDFLSIKNPQNTVPSATMLILPVTKSDTHMKNIYDDNFKHSDLSDGVTEIVGIDFGIKYSLFVDYLKSDTLYPALGVLAVFFIMWFYIGSIFITFMTIVSLIMALVFAYFIYIVVLGFVFFPFMNLCAVILIVGIGADDTFVFCDIWKKSRFAKPHTPCVIVLIETLRHAVLTMFVTSFTTAAAFYVNSLSSITAIRCFAVYAGTAIIINFFLTLTWLPAVVVLHDYLCQKFTCLSIMDRHETYNNENCTNKVLQLLHKIRYNASEYSRIFFEKLLPCIIIRLRMLWLISLLVLAVAGVILVFVTPRLNLPTVSEFQLLGNTHPFEKYEILYKHLFWFEKLQESESHTSTIEVNIVFGVLAEDNSDHWNPDSKGFLVWDNTFDVSSPESQVWMYEFCQRLRTQSFYKTTRGYHPESCFMEGFRDWMSRKPCVTTSGVDYSPCCDESTFPYTKTVFEYCLKELVLYLYDDLHMYFDGKTAGPKFDTSDDKIRVVLINFNAEFEYSVVYGHVSNFWNGINDWLVKELESAPTGLRNAWAVSDESLLSFYDLQHNLAIGTPNSLVLSVSIAAVVLLLTTRNTIISFYAMLSISGAIFVTIGILVLLGWELNILESVIISVAVGLSIDFTVHYGVAYQLAQEKDRESRVIFSVSQMGCAITMAAITTFAAGAFMMPSIILSYTRMGIFLMLIMTITWVYSTFFFQSLCHLIGPEQDFGQLSITCCHKGLCKGIGTTQRPPDQNTSLQSSSLPQSCDSVELDCLTDGSFQTIPVFKSRVGCSPCVKADRLPCNGKVLRNVRMLPWNPPPVLLENNALNSKGYNRASLGEAAIHVLHPSNYDDVTRTNNTQVVLEGKQYLTRVYQSVPKSEMIPNNDPTLPDIWVPLNTN